jgi:integrase
MSFFDWLAAKGYTTGNLAKLVPVDLAKLTMEQKEPKEKMAFTHQEIVNLLRITDPATKSTGSSRWWHYAISVGRYAGLRLGDIAQMEFDNWHVNDTIQKLVVWTEKRDKRVSLKIDDMGQTGRAALLLAWNNVKHGMLSVSSSPMYIFPEEAAITLDARRRSLHSKQFGKLCKEAGIEGKTFHSLRRTFITDAKKKGIPMEHIAAQVGHSSTKTTEAYVSPIKRKFA